MSTTCYKNSQEQIELYSLPRLNDQEKPLVSVCIFNYNYGRFLRQCFDSVIAQTYDNIEINFSDNASSDESWEIALEYVRKYPGKMTVTCNRRNFGTDANFRNCYVNIRGKYYMQLCSDDAIQPDFIEKCVNILEAHPSVGFAMVHRTIIDDDGNVTDEPPFYNQSCIIKGEEQAAVYMMAAVNPSVSQILYNLKATYGKSAEGGIATRWYGQRILDFNICCEHPIAYLTDSLLLHRLHSHNDSFRAADNLMEVIGPYVLQHQFTDTASRIDNMNKVVERLPQSVNKLANLCLRYSLRALTANNESNALRYFHLSVAMTPDIMNDPVYQELQRYWSSESSERCAILQKLQAMDNVSTRSVSYDAPPGSIPL